MRLFIAQDHAVVSWTGPCGCLLDRTMRLFIAQDHAVVYWTGPSGCLLYADVYCMLSFIVCGCLLLVYCMWLFIACLLYAVVYIAILARFSKRHSFLYERYNYRSHADVMLE
jgi:hypothetical protein